MHGNTSRAKREIPGFLQLPLPGMDAGAQREVGRRTPLMHAPGKSDGRVVPRKVPNKARRRAAEGLEGRRLAERNSPQAATLRTQGRARVHAALGRVRHAAEQKKGVRFTALLHHIYAIDSLRAAFYELKRDAAPGDAAPGVDGQTWAETTELLASASAEASADASMLEEFCASDTWMMRKCPLGVGNGIIRFVGLTDQLSVELKIAIRAKFTDREWSVASKQAFLVNRIVSWLTTDHSTTKSLLDQPLELWMHSFRRYLLDRGVLRQPIQQELTRTQQIRRWPLRDPAIVMLRSLYAKQLMLFRPSPTP